jgi:uncharacterized membrane-anchored protein YhcB (DUF1043 family)
MAEKETKTIDGLLNHHKDDAAKTREIIKEQWIFGWDLESITSYTKQIEFIHGGIRLVNLHFVRGPSIPNYYEILSLERQINNSKHPNSPSSFPGLPPVNPEDKKETRKFVRSVIISSVFVLLGIFVIFCRVFWGLPLFFLIAGIIVGIIAGFVVISCFSSRKNEIKLYKVKYPVYQREYDAYQKEYDAYRKSCDAIDKNKTECLEKIKHLSESNSLRQASLRKRLEAWENG